MTYLAVNCLIALIALVVERFMGYPDRLYAWVRHPVVWFGGLISLTDKRLNHSRFSEDTRKLNGALSVLALVFITFVLTAPLSGFLRSFPGGIVLEALLVSSLLAQKSLHVHVKAVAEALSNSLHAGREAVRHIVGRDPENLDESEISKAAIESLAENASDGVIAPLFWMLVFGLPGAAIYKAINTADSMIGHRSEKYRAFGFAAARLDDGVNYLPARLSAALFALAAWCSGKWNGRKAVAAIFRDAPHHASPNAGWPEAAMAGALDIRLGGRRSYQNHVVNLAEMGDGRAKLARDDIHEALRLYSRFLTLTALFVGSLLFLSVSIAN